MTTPETTADALPEEVVAAVRGARRVLVLSGAGMSAESGVPTFRDAQTGLWEEFDPAQLATAEAWQEDPPFVWGWYAWRMHLVRGVDPNAGHRALAELGRLREVAISTQNVDDLHERAGSDVAAHVHGSLFALRCADCGAPYEQEVDLPTEPQERLTPPECPACGGHVRPGVVWFGEMLPEADVAATESAIDALEPGDVALVVGTSGIVFPAAGYPAMARAEGATVIEVNPLETDISDMCHHVVRGTAAEVLPALVAAVRDADR
ncbi:NAD-dependent deacylase [Janibacter cremeus]|uniref:SIR2 family NAD-dependent protein deacylase n=1 Tax=Janibacter cremeus TaxID=1285192 RepID=UPI0023F6B13C|nr:NAD-dependent deacylase [Janibacter cremeus]WEV78528.1 NAD-dependent deacylase [Janibacter cremeus]